MAAEWLGRLREELSLMNSIYLVEYTLEELEDQAVFDLVFPHEAYPGAKFRFSAHYSPKQGLYMMCTTVVGSKGSSKFASAAVRNFSNLIFNEIDQAAVSPGEDDYIDLVLPAICSALDNWFNDDMPDVNRLRPGTTAKPPPAPKPPPSQSVQSLTASATVSCVPHTDSISQDNLLHSLYLHQAEGGRESAQPEPGETLTAPGESESLRDSLIIYLLCRLPEFTDSSARASAVAKLKEAGMLTSPTACPPSAAARPQLEQQVQRLLGGEHLTLHSLDGLTCRTQYLPQEIEQLRQFRDFQIIGSGASGIVYRAIHAIDGQVYALKCISLFNTEENRREVVREVSALAGLNHPHIVRYYAVWWQHMAEEDRIEQRPECSDESGSSSDIFNCSTLNSSVILFPNESNSEGSYSYYTDYSSEIATSSTETNSEMITMVIQMEYCGSQTLREALDDSQSHLRHANNAWYCFRQIVEAVAFIHQNNIIHRDLKPANVFFSQDKHVRIGDFGLATRDAPDDEAEHTGNVGTLLYMAPEIRSSDEQVRYTPAVDIYSLGIILLELFHPFHSAEERHRVVTALRDRRELPDKWVRSHERQARLVLLMTDPDPARRPSARDLCIDPKLVPPMNSLFDTSPRLVLDTVSSRTDMPVFSRSLLNCYAEHQIEPLLSYFSANALDDADRGVITELHQRGAVCRATAEIPLSTPQLNAYSGLSAGTLAATRMSTVMGAFREVAGTFGAFECPLPTLLRARDAIAPDTRNADFMAHLRRLHTHGQLFLSGHSGALTVPRDIARVWAVLVTQAAMAWRDNGSCGALSDTLPRRVFALAPVGGPRLSDVSHSEPSQSTTVSTPSPSLLYDTPTFSRRLLAQDLSHALLSYMSHQPLPFQGLYATQWVPGDVREQRGLESGLLETEPLVVAWRAAAQLTTDAPDQAGRGCTLVLATHADIAGAALLVAGFDPGDITRVARACSIVWSQCAERRSASQNSLAVTAAMLRNESRVKAPDTAFICAARLLCLNALAVPLDEWLGFARQFLTGDLGEGLIASGVDAHSCMERIERAVSGLRLFVETPWLAAHGITRGRFVFHPGLRATVHSYSCGVCWSLMLTTSHRETQIRAATSTSAFQLVVAAASRSQCLQTKTLPSVSVSDREPPQLRFLASGCRLDALLPVGINCAFSVTELSSLLTDTRSTCTAVDQLLRFPDDGPEKPLTVPQRVEAAVRAGVTLHPRSHAFCFVTSMPHDEEWLDTVLWESCSEGTGLSAVTPCALADDLCQRMRLCAILHSAGICAVPLFDVFSSMSLLRGGLGTGSDASAIRYIVDTEFREVERVLERRFTSLRQSVRKGDTLFSRKWMERHKDETTPKTPVLDFHSFETLLSQWAGSSDWQVPLLVDRPAYQLTLNHDDTSVSELMPGWSVNVFDVRSSRRRKFDTVEDLLAVLY